ncbi:MAG: low molecular weight phosphatase family protein [Candidatus Bathyarchaeales archaeon]
MLVSIVGRVGALKVLFVCSGNVYRSPLAEALLRKIRPDWVVDSAGIRLVIPIAEEVKEFLKEENAEKFLKTAPESLSSKRLMDYDVIVAMEDIHKEYVLSLCPKCKDKIVVWNIPDPYLMNKEAMWKIFKQIKKKALELANSNKYP